jgi:hypothetical protein
MDRFRVSGFSVGRSPLVVGKPRFPNNPNNPRQARKDPDMIDFSMTEVWHCSFYIVASLRGGRQARRGNPVNSTVLTGLLRYARNDKAIENEHSTEV